MGQNKTLMKRADGTWSDGGVGSGLDADLIHGLTLTENMDKTFYVDAGNGNDDNDGSKDKPFKTLKKAIDSIPVGGCGEIYLLGSEDFIIDDNIFIKNKLIRLFGSSTDTTTKPVVRNKCYVQDYYGTNYNATNGIILQNAAFFAYRVTFQTANYIDASLSSSHEVGLFLRWGGTTGGQITLEHCTVKIGDTPFAKASNRQMYDLIHYYKNDYYNEDYSVLCNGENTDSYLIGNDDGTYRVSFTNYSLGNKRDGSSLSYLDLLHGLKRDSDSGNPINVISNINFSS